MSIDSAIISQAVATYRAGGHISDLEAKVIANAWHGGQSSALYSFTSTGAILGKLECEIEQALATTNADELAALWHYVKVNAPYDRRGPVDGWSDLSW